MVGFRGQSASRQREADRAAQHRRGGMRRASHRILIRNSRYCGSLRAESAMMRQGGQRWLMKSGLLHKRKEQENAKRCVAGRGGGRNDQIGRSSRERAPVGVGEGAQSTEEEKHRAASVGMRWGGGLVQALVVLCITCSARSRQYPVITHALRALARERGGASISFVSH